MADSSQPVLKRIIHACSRLLAWVGAIIFFFGAKFLHEIRHVSLLVSEVVGILGGLLLLMLGVGLAVATGTPRQEEHPD